MLNTVQTVLASLTVSASEASAVPSDTWERWIDQRRAVRQRRAMVRETRPVVGSAAPDPAGVAPAPDDAVPPEGLAAGAAPASPEAPLDLASNDYLGLSRHPRVRQAAAEAALVGTVGAGASRVVTGTHPVHAQLEAALAELTGADAALVFSSGYTANLGVLGSLGGPRCTLLLDEHVHASLRDAARLSGAAVRTVPHADPTALDAALAEVRDQDPAGRVAVVVESVYSVLGDAADLPGLARRCARRGALLVIDEAHSLGVVESGSAAAAAGLLPGAPAEAAAADPDEVPPILLTGTLSKAFGAQGGAALLTGGRQRAAAWRDHLVNSARPFIFDTGLSPVLAAAALAAVRLAADGAPARALAERRELALRTLTRRAAVERVLDPGAAAVVSLRMPDPAAAQRAARELRDRGILVACFRSPSVPDGVARLRLSLHADHDPERLGRALEEIASVVERSWGAPASCPFAHGDPRPAEHRQEVFLEDPEQVRAVMGDPGTFAPDNALTVARPLCARARRILAAGRFQLPPVLASASGDLHRMVRKIATGFFSPRTFRAQLPRIRAFAQEELDALEVGCPVTDLASTVAAAVPTRGIELLTGVPNPPAAQLRTWSEESLELFWGWPDDRRQVRLARSAVEFHRWLTEAVESSRGSQNLFGTLLAADVAPARVVSLGYLLVIAGQETTRMLTATALDRALRDRDLWARLGAPDDAVDGGAVGTAAAEELVAECLRAASSVPTWRRVAAEDATVGDREIAAGTQLLLRLSGEAMPDHRLAFGYGPHRCLGAGLAEAEAAIVVRETARRFPQARLTGAEPSWSTLLSFQAPQHVHVRLR